MSVYACQHLQVVRISFLEISVAQNLLENEILRCTAGATTFCKDAETLVTLGMKTMENQVCF